jgi:hypothetical protein
MARQMDKKGDKPLPKGVSTKSDAAAAPQSSARPDPPPQFTQQGLTRVPNPAYADYVQKYGEPQPAGPKKSSAAEKARADNYNPFIQNRVR